jgi:hypothetical protein
MITIAALLTSMVSLAQTLNVSTNNGSVIDQFPSAQTGTMTFANGSSLTILNKTFELSEVTKMWTDETAVSDNEVNVVYNGDAALVYVAGNIAQYITASVSGAHVTITQSDAITNDLIKDGTFSEITYNLSGTSTDGSLTLGGSAKCTVAVNGLELTNPNGAPINITNGKRIDFSVKKGSTNTLKDSAASTAKGCLYCKGHLELKGKGVLNVYAYGSAAHGIKSGDYTEMKNCTVNILAATKDGLSCNEYFLIESGELTISGTGDDGIQCDIDNDEGVSTGELTDHEDEDSGNIYIEGGTINVTVTANAAKGIKGEGDMKITDGTVIVKTTGGGVWDADKVKTKASACLGADGNMTISGGTLTLTSTGAGGKGLNVDGALNVSGGTVTISTSGNAVVASSTGTLSVVTNSRQLDNYSSDYKSSPKGIKADGAITISDQANISVTTTGAGGEGIESKTSIDITGGQVTVNANDDAINASYNTTTNGTGNLTISGGYVYACSTGNDGLDANGNCYIQGGLVYAIGSGGAEKSIDANTEEQKKLYITGGTIIAVGDLENGASISGGTCKYTTSWNEQSWYALYNGGTLVAAFKTPTKSSSGGGGGWPGGGGPGGGGPGGGGSQKLIVYTSSTPTLSSGVTVSSGTEYFGGVTIIGGTVNGGSSVTLTNYNSGGAWW